MGFNGIYMMLEWETTGNHDFKAKNLVFDQQTLGFVWFCMWLVWPEMGEILFLTKNKTEI